MMTYDEAAEKIGVPRGTLVRRIATNNKAAEENPDLEKIEPDYVADHGHYKKFYFTQETVDLMAELIKKTRPGRPSK